MSDLSEHIQDIIALLEYGEGFQKDPDFEDPLINYFGRLRSNENSSQKLSPPLFHFYNKLNKSQSTVMAVQ